MTFKEFLALDELKLRGISNLDFGKQIPRQIFRKGGPEHMNPFKTGHLPARPYILNKTGIANRKH